MREMKDAKPSGSHPIKKESYYNSKKIVTTEEEAEYLSDSSSSNDFSFGIETLDKQKEDTNMQTDISAFELTSNQQYNKTRTKKQISVSSSDSSSDDSLVSKQRNLKAMMKKRQQQRHTNHVQNDDEEKEENPSNLISIKKQTKQTENPLPIKSHQKRHHSPIISKEDPIDDIDDIDDIDNIDDITNSANADIAECGSFIAVEDNNCVRRSKRHRIKPLEYWKNESVELKRFSTGVGSVLPIPVAIHSPNSNKETKQTKLTSSHHSSDLTKPSTVKSSKVVQEPSKLETPSNSSLNPSMSKLIESPILEVPSSSASKLISDDSIDCEIKQQTPDDSIIIERPTKSSSSTEVTEFGTIFLYDKIIADASIQNTNLVSAYKCDCQLVGHNQIVPMQSLYDETPEIRGGASLEAENLFISGIFVIPPKLTKVLENCGDNCLIVVMLEGEDNKVQVTINSNSFRLQKWDVFWVPKQNEYAIMNSSTSKEARFIFINIRSDF